MQIYFCENIFRYRIFLDEESLHSDGEFGIQIPHHTLNADPKHCSDETGSRSDQFRHSRNLKAKKYRHGSQPWVLEPQ